MFANYLWLSSNLHTAGLASQLLRQSGVGNYDGSLREVVVPGRTKAVTETIYIGIANCVVDETGRPMPIPKMRKPQVVAELQVCHCITALSVVHDTALQWRGCTPNFVEILMTVRNAAGSWF